MSAGRGRGRHVHIGYGEHGNGAQAFADGTQHPAGGNAPVGDKNLLSFNLGKHFLKRLGDHAVL